MKNHYILYNYGQFKHREQNTKEEKEHFFDSKTTAITYLCLDEPDLIEKNCKEEEKMDKVIKERIPINPQKWIDHAMKWLVREWGISFKDLDINEKNEICKLDLTFDSFKEYAKNYHLKYRENCIKIIPEMDICFQDIFFIYFCQLYGKAKITINNMLNNIRDYFILEKCPEYYDNYRDKEVFKNIQGKVIDLYPYIKEKYGINRYLDKFLSYLFKNNDYNNEKTKKILDLYYNKNNSEYIKIKDIED